MVWLYSGDCIVLYRGVSMRRKYYIVKQNLTHGISVYDRIILWVSEIVVIALFAPIPSKQRPKYNQHRKNMIKARGIAGVLIIGAVSLGVKSYNNYIVWIWLLQIINRRDKRL